MRADLFHTSHQTSPVCENFPEGPKVISRRHTFAELRWRHLACDYHTGGAALFQQLHEHPPESVKGKKARCDMD